MTTCARQDEVRQSVRAGHWPHGCTSELREHVASCTRCKETARLLSAFALAREATIRAASPQSPELLWWKAQVRRRYQAMERLDRPGLTIPAATIVASIILLLFVAATAWKRVDLSRYATAFVPAEWSHWAFALLATALCGLAVAAVAMAVDSSEDQR